MAQVLEQDMQDLPDPILQVKMVVMVMMMSEHVDRHRFSSSGTHSAGETAHEDANEIPYNLEYEANASKEIGKMHDAQDFLPKSISFTPCFSAFSALSCEASPDL